jgi:hypothetical protein
MANGSFLAGVGAALVAVGAVGGWGMSGLAQPGGTPSAAPSGQPSGQPAGQPAGAPGGGPSGQMIGAMVTGLKATPGCLEVELGQFASGKRTIFAWFKDKAAAMAWYNAKEHQAAMDSVAPGRDKTKKPMADVAEDAGPIMAVASFTPGTNGPGLAIELYAPMKAGLRMPGAGFSPEEFHALVAGAKAGGAAPAAK